MKVIKRNGSTEPFFPTKIVDAVTKSANRIQKKLTREQEDMLIANVCRILSGREELEVTTIHDVVEDTLKNLDTEIYNEYRSYRNYKRRFNKVFQNIIENSKSIIYNGDKENANKNSAVISTKKELIAGQISKQIMLEYELTPEQARAHIEGQLHYHDLTDRFFGSINCCLFDLENLLKGGFKLNGVHYTEPQSIESALRVMSDVVLSASSQQYGGFSLVEVDKVLAPYVRKSMTKTKAYFTEMLPDEPEAKIDELVEKQIGRAVEDGLQAVETKLNTINNCNGQTSFITMSYGLDTTPEGRLISKTIIQNRMNGLGRTKLTPLFPKLVFLHRFDVNGKIGAVNYDLKQQAIKCSAKRIYPDYLSLDAGYLGEMYDKYGLAITPMGCRAFLSPYFPEGSDKPVFVGRANCGAITLNLVRYALEAKGDKQKLYELIDKYFEMGLQVHLDTFDKLKKIKASSNPLFFCEGGCHIRLKPNETIERAIKTFTWSFGYIGLQELTHVMTGKDLHEDNSLAIEVLTYLKKKVDEAKEQTGLLFALYSTPAESLCYRFNNLDREAYGVVEGATDKPYYMNSFHVDVKAHINAIEKQRVEKPLFHIATGGRIHYNEFPNTKNYKAMEQMVNRAMEEGYYYGINTENDTCNNCGADGEFTGEVCPVCGSHDITCINRVCGYLGYKKHEGETRYNAGKLCETNDRTDHFE